MQLIWKTAWQFLKMLNINLSSNPEILLLGIYTRDLNVNARTETHTHTLGLIPKSQKAKTTPKVYQLRNG